MNSKNLSAQDPTLATKKWYGLKDWADEQIRYLFGLFSDNNTWNLPHNWHFKRVVARLVIDRLGEAGFGWHVQVASGHFHRWLKRKSWEFVV
jgi:hypothetical protein